MLFKNTSIKRRQIRDKERGKDEKKKDWV